MTVNEDIKQACAVMERGGVILYPTDTVWGIGCDATNEEAVRQVYDIKHRADSKAMFYVREVPPVAWDLIELSTRPLTIIYDGARNLAPNLLAEDGSVGIRVTNEPFSKQLCMRFKRAIVSTSANISGRPAPSIFADIDEEIKAAVDYVVESNVSGKSWYRKYKSGWIEQGGYTNSASGGDYSTQTNVTFLKAFTQTPLQILVSPYAPSYADGTNFTLKAYNASRTGFVYFWQGGDNRHYIIGSFWYACGK